MKRHLENPIISRTDIVCNNPCLYNVSSVFNPGAVRWKNQIVLLLRVQNRGRETYLLPAFSRDGIRFEIDCRPVVFEGIEKETNKIYHVYDPRITAIGDTCYITLALDIDGGCRVGLARTSDFRSYEFLGIAMEEDARNAVLFPEKIDGKYAMLYRPNRQILDGAIASGSEIELAYSTDLKNWTSGGVVMGGRFHYWDEFIGSGPPPLKTERGWLHLYHGIATHFGSSNIYQAGVVLLDLKNPRKVIARGRYNILEPREMYELTGQVPNVVFPSGLIEVGGTNSETLKENSELYLYYGAADTCIGLAITSVGELLEACEAQ